MFTTASRGMGAARTSAWFGIAPFAGVTLSLLMFREFPGLQFVIAIPFIIAGALLLSGEEHDHMHIHPSVVHEHFYTPDRHHPFETSGSPRHRHGGLRHSHPHRPDIHHRHGHDDEVKSGDDRIR